MPTRVTLYYYHMINVNILGFPVCFRKLISIWALIEKASSLLCCLRSEYCGYEISFCNLCFLLLSLSKLFFKICFYALKLLVNVNEVLFHLGPTLAFEDWKQITLDKVMRLALLKVCCCCFFLTYCTCFIWFRIFE